MKLAPGPLPPLSSGTVMDRLPLPNPFSPDILWRYPLTFPTSPAQLNANALMDFKTHLPAALATDPRLWSRDDVVAFLKYSEREFDLQPFDLDTFQMNGKALCLLNRHDLSERSPGSGDVLHNVLQLLIRDATILQRCLPSSPVTPTSRHAYPLSPHSHPSTPSWNIWKTERLENGETFHPSIAAHFMAQNNSVTLSPAPSVDSQAGSPQHAENQGMANGYSAVFGNGSNGSGSNQSDSEEDSYLEQNGQSGSPPNTPGIHSMPPQIPSGPPPKSPKDVKDITLTFGAFRPLPREFFPVDSPEPNTNGRLLWDFLQQLLNDPTQRYTNYIAWKNRDTGVFKIVDPAGLAKLWGIQKNHLSMNYDKMSRALRYYYRVNILRKVQGERHCYQFLRNPTEMKNIKNISLLRQQMSPTRPNPLTQIQQPNFSIKSELQIGGEASFAMSANQIKSEIDIHEHKVQVHDEDMPTDLSMVQQCPQVQPTDLSLIKNSMQDNSYHSLKLERIEDKRSDNKLNNNQLATVL